MRRVIPYLDQWLAYSVRRLHLDHDLEDAKALMKGRVLEVGNGRRGRRGRFEPPTDAVEDWFFADINASCEPDVRTDIECLPFSSGTFDTVVCLEVLEYVADPFGAVAEMGRVLKPDGHVIFSTPFLHRCDHESDRWRFTENGLRLLIQKADLDVVEIKAQGGAMASVVSILKYAIFTLPSLNTKRRAAFLAYYPLSRLWRFDARAGNRWPILKTYSTGYLSIARVLPDDETGKRSKETTVAG